jgi:hypothetical protein
MVIQIGLGTGIYVCVESDFKVPNLLLSLRFKGSGCHYKSVYNNTGIK